MISFVVFQGYFDVNTLTLVSFLLAVGTNLNGPVTGFVGGNLHKQPLPREDERKRTRSKSFPWVHAAGVELSQSMASCEETAKEPPVEVFIIFLACYNTKTRKGPVHCVNYMF